MKNVTFFLIALLFLCIFSINVLAEIPNAYSGTKGIYRMNNESGMIIDNSGTGNTLTESGDVVAVAGTIDGAGSFNGGDYLTDTTFTGIDNSSGIGFGFWALFDDTTNNKCAGGLGNNAETRYFGFQFDGGFKCYGNVGGTGFTAKLTGVGTGYYGHYFCKINASGAFFYYNGVLNVSDTSDPLDISGDAISDFSIGTHPLASNYANGAFQISGDIDEVVVFNRNLPLDEIQALAADSFGAPPAPSTTSHLNYTRPRPNESEVITWRIFDINTTVDAEYNFNASLYINESLVETREYSSGKNIYVNFTTIRDQGDYNYSIKFQYDGIKNFTNTTKQTFRVDFIEPVIEYKNYFVYLTNNYTRNLTYVLNITHCPSTAVVRRYIDGTLDNETNFTCSTNLTRSIKYFPDASGQFNISFIVNLTSIGGNESTTTKQYDFLADLEPAQIVYINISYPDGFFNPIANVSLICSDDIAPIIEYNITYNSENVYFGNLTNGSTASNNYTLNYGNNVVYGYCKDFFSKTRDSIVETIYTREISLIDEVLGTPFDYTNVSSLIIYFDDNSTSYDFKAHTTTTVNFTSSSNNKLRLEIDYYNQDVVTRYVDVALGETNELRICANTDDRTHYEQLIISATQRRVSLKSVFSNCVVAEDYTRFVYQNSYVLKAYTINRLYYLYSYDDNDNKVYLASMDGSLQTYYNIDILEFNNQEFDLSIAGDSLTISNYNDMITLFYSNLDNDSVKTELTITEINGSNVLFHTIETDSPNNIYMYFDYSTLNLSDKSTFKAEVQVTNGDGEISIIKKYFNIQGESGILTAGFALTISIFLIFFGLTFTISRLSLSWFGIVAVLASIIVLSLSTPAWYITFFMGLNIIVLIYIIILLTQQNTATVT